MRVGKWFFSNRDWTPVPFWIVLFAATFIWRDLTPHYLFKPAGYLLIIIGEIIRMACIRRARSITRTRSGKTGDRVIKEGLFRISRNPIYIGNGIIGIGFTFLSGFYIAPVLFFLLFMVQYSLVIAYEESVLENRFGDEYREYKKSVPRWIGITRLKKAADPTDIDIYDFSKILKSERHTFMSIITIAFLMQLSALL